MLLIFAVAALLCLRLAVALAADICMWPVTDNCDPNVQFFVCSAKTARSCGGTVDTSYESCLANPVYFSCCQLAKTFFFSQSFTRRSVCAISLTSDVNCNSSLPVGGKKRDVDVNVTAAAIDAAEFDDRWVPAEPQGSAGSDECAEPDAVGTVVDGTEYITSLESINMTHAQAHAAIKAGTLQDAVIVAAHAASRQT